MLKNSRITHAFAICVYPLLVLVMLVPGGPLAAQSQPKGATQAAAKPAADIGWPRQVVVNGAKLVYYQPQVDQWKDYRDLTADLAFSLTPQGGQPALGVATLTAKTDTDLEHRTVLIRDIKVSSVRFPSLDAATAEKMGASLRQVFPTQAVTISLDRMIAAVERSKKQPARAVAVNNQPPQIFTSTDPAILLMADGGPVLAPVESTSLEFMVNTNWDVFHDKQANAYYLLDGRTWLTAPALNGPWTVTHQLPAGFSHLPAGKEWDDVRAAIPPAAGGVSAPRVFFSNKPAELIVFKGQPVYANIKGTNLSFATNTDSDVFLQKPGNEIYFLTSGRWFRAHSLDGPWTYAGGDLPADFAKIPSTSPKANVLASVPGTRQAEDAVLLAQIPTTAVINRAQAEAAVKVAYNGTPQFKPIESTPLEYATNTPEQVIKDGDMYYLCYQGVWFMSARPDGPWKTADSVPQAIYSIPPSSPVYNVTYVTVSDPTPTTVEASYTGGYLGSFLVGTATGLAIAYGTGYYYPPYYGSGAYGYPVYHPYPNTYGAHAVYNPYTGAYGVGHAAYGPYGAAGGAAAYNPNTGRYGRAATVQTPYGGRTAAAAYNPWTGGYGATQQGHNAFSQWGSSVATRNGQAVQTGHVTTAQGTAAGYRTSTGQAGTAYHSAGGGMVAKSSGGDLYAGKDGNVYQKNPSGGWSKYQNGNWAPVSRQTASQPANQATGRAGEQGAAAGRGLGQTSGAERSAMSSETMGRLNQEAATRQAGNERVREAQSMGGRVGGEHGNFGGGRFGGRGGGGRRR